MAKVEEWSNKWLHRKVKPLSLSQLMLNFPESYTGGSLVCELYPNLTLLTWIISIWGKKAESAIESRWLLLL